MFLKTGVMFPCSLRYFSFVPQNPWETLPVTFRIVFKILLLIFKAIAPGYITELINIKNEGRYRLRSNSNGILLQYVKFKTYKTLGDRSFMAAAPNLWNNLPLESAKH